MKVSSKCPIFFKTKKHNTMNSLFESIAQATKPVIMNRITYKAIPLCGKWAVAKFVNGRVTTGNNIFFESEEEAQREADKKSMNTLKSSIN